MGISAKWRGRAPVALLTAGSLAVVGLAVGGASGVPGLEFLQPGHWVLNSALGKVFHVDGATKRVNAEVAVPGAERGSLVVQGDTSGYVVGRGKYTEFGKSTLRVEGTTAAPTDDELPVALEVAGGPYLVYREAGRVVRLGDNHTDPIEVDERLGHPVATPDGTVWLHYTDSGRLCRLTATATTPSCPVTVAAGHTGGLAVVGDKPVFVDTTADTVSLVEDTGLTRETPIGRDVPEDAEVGTADATGRVPVLDPGGALVLVDGAAVVGDRPPAETVVVPLDPGDYSRPESTGTTVAVLDQRGGTLHTYDSTDGTRRKTPVPPERGTPRLTRGDDARVYVESGEGKHVLVVDPGGQVTPVPVDGTRPAGSATTTEATTTTATTTAPPPADTRPPGQESTQPTTRRQTQQAGPVVPASPPGAPGGLAATPGAGAVTLAWGAAPDNGAPVTAYHVSWNGGAVTVGGGERGFTATGLANGTAYAFTVVAQNSAGRGPGSTASATPFQPPTITITRGEDTEVDEDCRPPDCSLIHIELRGFAPNTDYTIVAHSTRWPAFNDHTSRSDAQGNVTTNRFAFGGVGQEVWVVAGGVTSNRLYWEDR